MRFKIKIIEISDDLKSNHEFDFKIKIVPISGRTACQLTLYCLVRTKVQNFDPKIRRDHQNNFL